MQYTIDEFNNEFPTDLDCLLYVFREKHKEKCECGGKYYRLKKRPCFCCSRCKKQIYPLKGTIFEKSTTPLKSWFFAIYLFSQAKNGVSAAELERHLGVGYKTAWRIAGKIRSLMKQGSVPLTGTVEADEMFWGGRRKLGSWKKKKTPVLGVVKRNGEVRVRVAEDTTSASIIPFLKENVKRGTNLCTDDYSAYRVKGGFGFKHQIVNHSAYEFVRGNTHTNTIEGVWGQIKNSLKGSHHYVSKKYLESYLNSVIWHYNRRDSSSPAFHDLLQGIWPS